MKLIFDIGFNHGHFTKECFNRYPDVQVVAIEANKFLCNKANTNNFVLINALASNKDNEDIDFYISPNTDGVSTASPEFMANSRFTKGSKNLPPNDVKWDPAIKVPSISIDTLVEHYGTPDLIKIDTEGYEYNVIKGLTKRCKDICFEWHEEEYDSLLKIINHLQGIGYDKFGVIGWFDEGDVFEKLTFSSEGDPYLVYPKEFYSWKELNINRIINPERRVNYGMIFAI